VRAIELWAGEARLFGDLALPPGSQGVVLFAHGSGSSRRSPRNQAVAASLERAGLATLLLDLLTAAEDEREARGAMLRFDVELLGRRLALAIDWLAREPATAALPLGLFGASTGAAAALIAAEARPDRVRAVVSRGGRPDLAAGALGRVRSPTLLIVGGADPAVLELNRRALERLACEKELAVVPGATHLFEERGALERVQELARSWFLEHLPSV
jgi:pimeloyl-ACP methyl ester carboxylesterase